jgi:hypothetical protein
MPTKKSSSTGDNKQALYWLSHHFVLIVMIIVGGILLIGLLKFLSQLFNGTGPVSKGVGDILGSGAHFIDGIVNGCTAQANCSNEGSMDDCIKGNGCSWKESTKSGDEESAVCVNTTGREVGTGSLISTSCVFGLGFLMYIGASVFLGAFGLFLTWGKNKLTRDTSAMTGKTSRQIVEAQAREIMDLVNKYNAERKKLGEKPLTEKGSRDLSRKVANKVVLRDALSANEGQSNMTNEEIAKNREELAKQGEEAVERDKEIAENTLSPEEIEANETAAEDLVHPVE